MATKRKNTGGRRVDVPKSAPTVTIKRIENGFLVSQWNDRKGENKEVFKKTVPKSIQDLMK